jgi:hypothetical protein
MNKKKKNPPPKKKKKIVPLLTGGGRAYFSENLRATVFNEDLLNETNFSRIHIAGQ